MILLNSQEVRAALPMAEAIEAMKTAFAALSSSRAEVPLRSRLEVKKHAAVTLVMPALVDEPSQAALAVKLVAVYPRNAERQLPIIHAGVLVLDPETGQLLALLEGGALTAIRTGAGSGAATDLLARPESRVAAVFGAGVQGRTQLEAICTVRPIDTVWAYDPNPGKLETFQAEMAGRGPIPREVRIARGPQEAVAEADIICAATTSATPVFSDRDLKPGVHINGVGSYTPDMVEIPGETVQRARVIVDSRQAAWAEAGDLIQPRQRGQIGEDHVQAELGEIVLGDRPGRETPDQVTFFKSVGVAVQDALAAQLALKQAQARGLGQRVDW